MSTKHLPSIAAAWIVIAATIGCSTVHPARSGIPATVLPGGWRSRLSVEHPLAGQIYDVASARFVTKEHLIRALAAADVVLLGEQHDNLDHHRLEADLVRELVAKLGAEGRLPAVAFEQLDLEDQPAIDAAIEASPTRGSGDSAAAAVRADALAAAVDWQHSGWPPFDGYREVFEVALGANLPIRAANLSRERLARARSAGAVHVGVSEAWQEVDLSADLRASLDAEIEETHCGFANEKMVEAMVESQRRRDDAMAAATLDAVEQSRKQSHAARGNAVVVCGFGHARRDRGVPLYLRHRAPALHEVSVAFVEVAPGVDTPADYAGALHAPRLPFDYVLFTPRVDDVDPCEKFRSQLQNMKGHGN